MKVTQFYGGLCKLSTGNIWNISGEIEVEGLGKVSIQDCLSTETIEKVCAEIEFALEQKMKMMK